MKCYSVFLLLGLMLLSFWSCRKDNFYSGSDEILEFSVDTLTFDTVFTTIGTITRFVKVKNTSNNDLLLDEIRLSDFELSPFRINVDGVPVSDGRIEDVLILKKDSIYIFVEATLGENNANDPLVFLQELQYFYNGVTQSSYLQAWGQDAYFHFGEIYENENVTWENDKPHVIVRNSGFPGVGVDSFSTLTILPGTKVFATAGSGLFIDGVLNVGITGNTDSVVFQSDRIETLTSGLSFEENVGLWYGIGIFSGAEANFHNVVINNATYGITGRFIQGNYQTFSNNSRPEILLDKVVIKNSALNALIALNSNLSATNCLFHTAGGNLVALALGGDYQLDNCTFYNAGGFGVNHEEAVLALSNFAQNQNGGAINTLERADITNCIIDGTLAEEISLNNLEQANFNYNFKNCLIKTELDIAEDSNFENCIVNENPIFENASSRNFRLTENSPCIDVGFDNGIIEDLDFKTRSFPIDIGAFEF